MTMKTQQQSTLEEELRELDASVARKMASMEGAFVQVQALRDGEAEGSDEAEDAEKGAKAGDAWDEDGGVDAQLAAMEDSVAQRVGTLTKGQEKLVRDIKRRATQVATRCAQDMAALWA